MREKLKLFLKHIRDKYRVVILNDNTFEEKISLRLNLLGIFILIGSITIVMTFLVISLVAFTPLREYIPGYGNVDQKKGLMTLVNRADSLENALKAKEWYFENLNNIINDSLENKPEKPYRDTLIDYSKVKADPSENDKALRNEVESADKYSLSISDKTKPVNSISNFVFFSPIKGIITSSFNLKEEHYGTDVAAKENEFIKATLDGTVVFAGFTNNDGYVLQVQHSNNIVSIYKHNSELMVRTGDYVKAGNPIAIVGNSGETSSGPHLHFELWYNGSPINPQDYIVF
jgi:murein DD-endopeptidase MepM/ murein hydrolase activator NlpD